MNAFLRKGLSFAVGLGLCGISATSMAQDWSDNFDSYSNGQVLFGVGGWDGWDNQMGVAGSATNAQARSAPHSILIEPNDDAIHPFTGLTRGRGTMIAWMLLERGNHVADTYFICQNEYNHGGPYQWFIQVQFDIQSGQVLDDFRTETNVINIAYDTWAQLRFEIDIDADTLTTYYNNVELSTGQCFTQGGAIEFKNIDLYSTGATNYFDDLSVRGLGGPPPYTCTITGTCPGTVRLAWAGAQPNRQQGILFARNTGNYTIGSGTCAGTQLGLGTNQLQLYNTIGTGSGSGSVNANAGPGACGGFVQLIQVPGCITSNVAQVP